VVVSRHLLIPMYGMTIVLPGWWGRKGAGGRMSEAEMVALSVQCMLLFLHPFMFIVYCVPARLKTLGKCWWEKTCLLDPLPTTPGQCGRGEARGGWGATGQGR